MQATKLILSQWMNESLEALTGKLLALNSLKHWLPTTLIELYNILPHKHFIKGDEEDEYQFWSQKKYEKITPGPFLKSKWRLYKMDARTASCHFSSDEMLRAE